MVVVLLKKSSGHIFFLNVVFFVYDFVEVLFDKKYLLMSFWCFSNGSVVFVFAEHKVVKEIQKGVNTKGKARNPIRNPLKHIHKAFA